MYNWEFSSQALKEFEKLSSETQRRLITKLDYFVSSQKPLEFAENLINFDIGQYRFRVGDYRIIFDLEDETIIILSVGHRREIYK